MFTDNLFTGPIVSVQFTLEFEPSIRESTRAENLLQKKKNCIYNGHFKTFDFQAFEKMFKILFFFFYKIFTIEVEISCEQRTTISGLTCQSWSEQSPHEHEFSPDSSSFEIPDDNLCIKLHFDEPWCYTTDADVRWEACFPCDSEETTEEPATTAFPETTQVSTTTTSIMTRAEMNCENSDSDSVVTVDDSCVQISSSKQLLAVSSGTDISLSFSIPGNLYSPTASVLIEFPGTTHNVEFFGISGATAQRYDFKRFQILLSDDFDSDSELEIIGFLTVTESKRNYKN